MYMITGWEHQITVLKIERTILKIEVSLPWALIVAIHTINLPQAQAPSVVTTSNTCCNSTEKPLKQWWKDIVEKLLKGVKKTREQCHKVIKTIWETRNVKLYNWKQKNNVKKFL